MRSLVLVIAIALAGCGDADSSTAPDLAAGADMACSAQCGDCAAGTTCVRGSAFAAACLSSCNTTDDCAAGSYCVMIEGAAPQGSYCVTRTSPTYCSVCMAPAAIFCDGDVFVAPGQTVCGLVRTRCPHGCGSGDGGSFGCF